MMAQKALKTRVILKYLSNFWKTYEIPLYNSEINFILSWFKDCILISGNIDSQVPKLPVTDTKPYVQL